MKTLFYLILIVFISFPGVLLVYGAYNFKSRVNKKSGFLIFWGSILIIVHLIISSGNYLVLYLGDASDLAAYALIDYWGGTVLEYIGLLAIAIGLLVYRTKDSNIDKL